jgi:hypothetical protein
MKMRQWLMLLGLAVAAWLAFFGDKTAETGSVEPVAHRAPAPQPDTARADENAAPTAQAGNGARVLALRPRSELIASGVAPAEDGLFSSTTWEPPPKPAPPAPPPPPPPPPPAPVAPPLPFVYLGKQLSDGQMEVFLAQGNEVLVVRDQTVIKNTYRVESIGPQKLSLVYLPLGQVQQLSIGAIN